MKTKFIAFIKVSLLCTSLYANEGVATESQNKGLIILSSREIKELLGPFPTPGSVEEAADVETLMKFQENRTEEDCKLAGAEESATLEKMFTGILTKKEIKKQNFKLLKHYGEAGANMYIAKKIYGRPRPYLSHSQIKPCIALENTASYPSGHTTAARVLGRLLAKIYPERAEAIMIRAERVALNRVIGGVHYPSDIAAGKVLGDHILQKILENKEVLELIQK
jgi:acid phosphatase (class A)